MTAERVLLGEERHGGVLVQHPDVTVARALFEQSLPILQELSDRRTIALLMANLGIVAYNHGDYAAARALHEESLAISRELGDRWGIASSLNNLGMVAKISGTIRRRGRSTSRAWQSTGNWDNGLGSPPR